jgi:integrase
VRDPCANGAQWAAIGRHGGRIAHVADPYKVAVWLLAYTGLRLPELCGLRVAGVDSSSG